MATIALTALATVLLLLGTAACCAAVCPRPLTEDRPDAPPEPLPES